MTAFAFWQSLNAHEPLIPLVIFGDRDFSVCSVGVAIISFIATAMMLPLTFYAQAVCGLSPTRSALLIAPMAIANGVFAPFAGKIVDKYHPQPVLGFGYSVLAIALTWLTFEMSPATPIWRLVLPFFAMGVGMAFVWSPLTATATRNLPPQLAGAGSAVYNSVRQLGAVLGSAGMAAFMTWRITDEMPRQPSGGATGEEALTLQLPGFLREPFASAMSQSVLLPAFIALFGIIAALFLVGFAPWAGKGGDRSGDDRLGRDGVVDDDYDDDQYVELVLVREPDVTQGRNAEPPRQRVDRPRPAPPAPPRHDPRWHASIEDSAVQGQPIGHAHNGSHVDGGKRLRQVAVRRPPKSLPPGDRLTRPPRRQHNGPAGRHFPEGESLRGQHHRPDPDDEPTGYDRP
jgi:hypothetical protein